MILNLFRRYLVLHTSRQSQRPLRRQHSQRAVSECVEWVEKRLLLTTIVDTEGLGVFTGPNTVSNAENRPTTLATADVNGDGFLDVAAANYFGDSVVLLMNDGDGGFTRKVVDSSLNTASGVRVADLDGDGDLDVTANSFGDNLINWYENDGEENFTKHLISNAINGPVETVPVDIDGDGDLDLASTGYFNDRVTLFLNDGSGAFTPKSLSTSFDKAYALDASDLDSDGDLDLVVGAVNSDLPGIRWFENDGAGEFTERSLIAAPQKGQTIRSSDLDGDGDRDLIIAHFDDIAWFENDGNEAFTKHVISTTANERKTEIADVDGDGDIDLLVTSSTNDNLLLFRNDGAQNFSETLIAEGRNFWTVTVGDLDSDGDLDAITGTTQTSILWFENVAFDFGDAPAPYPTELAQDGARHEPIGPILGSARDSEIDGVHSTDADADGADEDGVVFGAVVPEPLAYYSLDGSGNDVAGTANGQLVGAVRFVDDGAGGTALLTNTGSYAAIPAVDAFKPALNSFSASLRFRLEGASNNLTFAPLLVMQKADFNDGVLFAVGTNQEFGDRLGLTLHDGSSSQAIRFDAPSSLLNEWHNAAYVVDRELSLVTLYLDGELVATETLTVGSIDPTRDLLIGQYDFVTARNGQPRFVGGQNLAIDDVRIFDQAVRAPSIAAIAAGPNASDHTIQVGQADAIVTVNVENALSGAKLDAWIDFNGDGSWGGPGEQVAAGVSVVNGSNFIAFDVPPDALPGPVVARFRLSSAGGLGFVGAAADGEVEDHLVTIEAASGNGAFAGSGQRLGDGDTFGVELADLDGDGDLDAIATSVGDKPITIWANDGDGNFAVHQVVDVLSTRGVSVADVDNDGDLDIVAAGVAIDGSSRVIINQGGLQSGVTGQFAVSDQLLPGGFDIALGDVDGDGDVDVVISRSGGDDRILINQGGRQGGSIGVFTDSGQSLGNDNATGNLLADLDGDGDLDYYQSNTSGAANRIFINQGGLQGGIAGVFTDSGQSLGRSNTNQSVAVDIDLDGDLDLVDANDRDQRNQIFVNQGGIQGGVEGTFTAGQSFGPTHTFDIAAADFDGDGDFDIVTSDRGAGTTVVWWNAGGVQGGTIGVLTAGPTLVASSFPSLAVGDLNGDNAIDVFLGGADDGEGSQDLRFDRVFFNNAVRAGSATKIASGLNGGPQLSDFDAFGNTVVPLGDLDGDGVVDLAVGAATDDTGGNNRGAVHVLFLNSDGTVKSSKKIASGVNGGPNLANDDRFGTSVATIGDVNGDGIIDLVAGASFDDTAGSNRGAAYVLFLDTDGTVKGSTKIASGLNGGPELATNDRFGMSVSSAGDLDGDGVSDLAVGAYLDDTNGTDRGAVHVLFLNNDGTARSATKIGSGLNGGPDLTNADRFGVSVESVGDLDGDGVADLAVGASVDDTNGTDRGAVHVLFLNTDGSVKNSTKIASGLNGGPDLANGDLFGTWVAPVGDLNADGVVDLGVGALHDDTGGTSRGAIHLLLMNSDGTAKSSSKIASGLNGGPELADFDQLRSVVSLGDLNGDGATDLAVGAFGDDTGGTDRGAVYVLFLEPSGPVDRLTSPTLHYTFDVDSSDAGQNGLNGIVTGSPVFESIDGNGVITFNNPAGSAGSGPNSTQYITIPNSPQLQTLSDQSFTTAVRYRSTDAGQGTFNGRLFGSGGGGQSGFSHIYNQVSSNHSASGVSDGTLSVGTSPDSLSDSAALTTDGEFHWVVTVVDREAMEARFYVDSHLISLARSKSSETSHSTISA